MATATFIPVEEYLRTSYRPDCDYVNGEVRERLWGEGWHASVMSSLVFLLGESRHGWQVRGLPSLRIKISPTRYRVADICVLAASEPMVPIPDKPPLLCIEILESTDRFVDVLSRVEDFIQMGVPLVWIIDSRSREIWTVGSNGRPVAFKGDELTTPGTPIRIPLKEIFRDIDEAPQGVAHGH